MPYYDFWLFLVIDFNTVIFKKVKNMFDRMKNKGIGLNGPKSLTGSDLRISYIVKDGKLEGAEHLDRINRLNQNRCNWISLYRCFLAPHNDKVILQCSTSYSLQVLISVIYKINELRQILQLKFCWLGIDWKKLCVFSCKK